MRRLKPAARGALGVLTMLTFATLFWIAAFFLTAWAYRHIAWSPPPLVRQLVTSLVGLVLMSCPMIVFGRLYNWPREQAMVQSVLTVIGRIAQGDFSARVDVRIPDRDHPMSRFVHRINDMAVELDRMERLRQEFISNVSHEIQSPLTSIGGFAKALRDHDPDPEDRRRYLDIIVTETDRLSRLSDNLLKLTALEGEQPPLEARRYRLDRQVRRIILAAEPLWSGRGLRMDADLEPAAVVADEGLMDQVWTNLLHNAVKFTPPGGGITVRLVRRAALVQVEVADTGIGISPDDQRRIFERFFKADPARGRDAGGSGLGLALAKRIVDLHGGDITARSTPGRGSCFTVSLPAAEGGAAEPTAAVPAGRADPEVSGGAGGAGADEPRQPNPSGP